MNLSFFGATGNVTGSCYLLQADEARFLVDCGLYQERNLRARNHEPFPFDPATIDAVLLTHGHLDHCGLLPKLVKQGYTGPIYCTAPSAEIASIVLFDSAKIQEEDLAFKRRRHAREGRSSPYPLVPIYTAQDVESTVSLMQRQTYDQPFGIADGVEASFADAGHILGSSTLRIALHKGGTVRSILFSGDLGRYNSPIIRDPVAVSQADFVVTESTYGDRVHDPNAHIPDALEAVINATHGAGGNLVIPSFAIERTQELLYHMSGLVRAGRIPDIMVVLDSPMAIKVTDVFRKYPELFDAESSALLEKGEHPCDFPGLRMTHSIDESKAINRMPGSTVIIAGAGMCTGGRIKHHLKHNIARPESTILFIGYQAAGTLGRIILDGAKRIRIHGEQHPVKARIERISGFSAHGDRDEIKRWLSGLRQAPSRVFVTHGEPEAAAAFAKLLRTEWNWNAIAPDYGQTETELDGPARDSAS